MRDFFEDYNIKREAEISIVLNTFMYIDYCTDLSDGRNHTIAQIISALHEEKYISKLNSSQKAALVILREYLWKKENYETANLIAVNFSNHMGSDYTGAYAAAFRNADTSDLYVVFRGTGVGRWYDNGDALAKEFSNYQNTAEKYFNVTVESVKKEAVPRIIVTGHSKGGNLAQYVTLVSPYREHIDKCVSFDGEGFSPEFLIKLGASSDIAKIYSNRPNYLLHSFPLNMRNQISKMYSVCGDNDYVNVLGIPVIPASNTVYIETDCPVTDVVASHSITPDFDSQSFDGKISANKNRYLYDWDNRCFRTQTDKTRSLSEILKNVSRYIMNEEQSVREKDCHAIMDALEAIMSRRDTGLNGENANEEEYLELIKSLPKIFIVAETTMLSGVVSETQKQQLKNQITFVKNAVEVLKDSLKKSKK